MAIPGFQSIMLPLLQHLASGELHSNQESLESLARELRISEEDRAKLLPSGRTPVFVNRVAWAKVHLKAANLIESKERGTYAITSRGREVLAGNPKRVDIRFLMRFPEYHVFRGAKKIVAEPSEPAQQPPLDTPLEQLEASFQAISDAVASELLQRLKTAPPAFFEGVVLQVLKAMGYGGPDSGRVTGKAGDGGIDGVIPQDLLGLDEIYIQAKRWEGSVGSPQIQQFVGALQATRSKKGVLITTSSFTKDAIAYARSIETKVILMDGSQLARFMMTYSIGVTSRRTLEVKVIDSDFFEDIAI
jgi:restriction system protein